MIRQLVILGAALAGSHLLASRGRSSRLVGGLLPYRVLKSGRHAVLDDEGGYLFCENGDGETLDDSECAGVLKELPDVSVPITARIRMTVGRVL